MFDIVIQPFVAKFDGTNILLACLAGHLTIFAFGYPYIYRAISNLSNISVILTERLKNNKLRKYYSKFIIVIFTSNLVSLLFPNIGMISILSCAFLFSHIWYVMTLYQIIENVAINPFEIVVNKNIHDANAVIKVPNEIEKDIELVIDLICYSEKNCFTEPDIAKYFTWLIDVTFLKLKNYDIDKFDHLFGVMPEDSEILFSTLSKIRWLNQWAVNEKKLMTLGLINNFYSWILEYGMSPTKNFNDEAYPILKNVRNTQNLDEEYENAKDNKAKYNIQKQYNFIKRIQNEILEEIKYVIFYRINNQFIASGEIYDLVQLLYYILSRKLEIKQNKKYEPCFSILSKMINKDMVEDFCNELFIRISKHNDYFHGDIEHYYNICSFHINIMAYLIYKNQYQKFKSYMNCEESIERTTQHTKPQIPNTINSILFNFIGNDSVFCNTETFNPNISSRKYKFYILFLLLANSKKFADEYKRNLPKINKKHWQYKFIKDDIKLHSDCTIDFSEINFDILMSYLIIENYNEYFEYFKNETELLNLMEFNNEDEQFIKEVLDKCIKQITKAQKKLLKEKFENVAKKEFSLIKQKELGVKNLNEFISLKLYNLQETIEKIIYKVNSNYLQRQVFMNLYEKTYPKAQILSGQYVYLFNSEPAKDFYSRLFSLIIENCQKIDDINNIPSNIDNFEILSNFEYKNNFESFGFNKANIKVKKTIVNGVEMDNFEYADVSSVIINDKEIKISQCNDNFHFLNINEADSYLLILFNPERISIKIGDLKPLRYEDLRDDQVKIIDDTQIEICILENKTLGYYVIKKNN